MWERDDSGGFSRGGYWRWRAGGVLLVLLLLWQPPADAAAAVSGWQVTEVPVYVGNGDQLSPDTDGSSVYFKDVGGDLQARLMVTPLAGGAVEAVYGAGDVWSGPLSTQSGLVWQDSLGQACQRPAANDGDRCVPVARASAMKAFGTNAIISEAGSSTIRLINFETLRSRMLDSYETPGMRYDPDIDGARAVWIRERGYAGKYYEPLVVSYDLASGVSTYLNKTGGGTNSTGTSKYQRRRPVINADRVFYQQKINEPGEQWDIYEADPAGFGVQLVTAAGDQVNPATSGRWLVYQDNRNGHPDSSGEWNGEWDIYLKDLETGEEQAVCTAAGDQVNPVIRGDTILWEDNRSGDWDIYAARLTPLSAGEPRLELSMDSVFWASYADYLASQLTVSYRLTNAGEGLALDAGLRQVVTTPAEVLPELPLPPAVATLMLGDSASFDVRFTVPRPILRFHTALIASCRDGSGTELWFPAAPG